MTETFYHRGCKIVIGGGTAAGGGAFISYEITPESDEAKAVFRRHGVDMISGSKMSDVALGASRREVDLLIDGRG